MNEHKQVYILQEERCNDERGQAKEEKGEQTSLLLCRKLQKWRTRESQKRGRDVLELSRSKKEKTKVAFAHSHENGGKTTTRTGRRKGRNSRNSR